jgi:hypothetical protein
MIVLTSSKVKRPIDEVIQEILRHIVERLAHQSSLPLQPIGV